MSVHKRGSRWYISFSLRGHRYREVIPEARTKAQAERAETQAREEVYAGKYGCRKVPDLNTYCERVFKPWILNNHESAQKSLYRLNNLTEHFGKMRLDAITVIEAEKYKRKRLDLQRSPITINKEVKLLKMLLKQAHEAGLLQHNPLRHIRMLREPDHRQRVLSPDEEARLLAACPAGYSRNVTVLRRAILMALMTGMRRGELYGLTWSQIDRSRNVIVLEKTKTAKARTIPISPRLAELLDAIPHEAARVLAGYYAHSIWARALTRAHVTGFRFHDLRHTAATRLADCGCDPFTIAAILGHSSIAQTARYSHATSERTRLALERLGATLPQTAFDAALVTSGTVAESTPTLRRMRG